jgi:hypothetical protein
MRPYRAGPGALRKMEVLLCRVDETSGIVPVPDAQFQASLPDKCTFADHGAVGIGVRYFEFEQGRARPDVVKRHLQSAIGHVQNANVHCASVQVEQDLARL